MSEYLYTYIRESEKEKERKKERGGYPYLGRERAIIGKLLPQE